MVPLYPHRTSARDTEEHIKTRHQNTTCSAPGSCPPFTICLAQVLYTCSWVVLVGNTRSKEKVFPCGEHRHHGSIKLSVQAKKKKQEFIAHPIKGRRVNVIHPFSVPAYPHLCCRGVPEPSPAVKGQGMAYILDRSPAHRRAED